MDKPKDREESEVYVPPSQRQIQAVDRSWFVTPPRDWLHPVTGRYGWQPDQALLTFGRYVRRSRYLAGMSQVQVAAASGVEQGSISRLERGLAPAMKVERVVRLAAAIGRDFPLGFCPHEHWCPLQPAPRLPEQGREDPEQARDALRVLYGLATIEEINAEKQEDEQR